MTLIAECITKKGMRSPYMISFAVTLSLTTPITLPIKNTGSLFFGHLETAHSGQCNGFGSSCLRGGHSSVYTSISSTVMPDLNNC